MDRSKRSLEEFKVSDSLVNKLLETLEIFKENNLKSHDTTLTKKGFQTHNIFELKTTIELKDEIMKVIKKDLDLFHVHLIEYEHQGEQEPHDHKNSEDYSFILYLNDSDGNTVFEDWGEIKPEKGKLVFFDSDIIHFGKPSIKGKKIAVGALKKH